MLPDSVASDVWELLFGAKEQKKVVVSFRFPFFSSPQRRLHGGST